MNRRGDAIIWARKLTVLMRILIVKLSSIGDVVHTLPAAALLRRALPEARIAWAVDRRASAVAIHWPPYVVVVPGVDQRPAGTKEAIREAVERLYER